MPSPLDQYRVIFVDSLRLLTPEQWNDTVSRFGEGRANQDVGAFLSHLETVLLLIDGHKCPALTPYQRARIENPVDRGASLLLRSGQLVLVKPLDEGGQGSIYLARRRVPSAPEQVVTLKITLFPTAVPGVAVRFERECRFLCDETKRSDPKSRHVVSGLDFFAEGAQSVLVMEFLPGPTIQTLADHSFQPYYRPIPVRTAVLLIDSVLKGLEFIHSNGCVHRDIKPKNLIFQQQPGNPYFVHIVDLGSLKVTGEPITRQFRLMGSMYFTAPECFRDASKADQRADLYSVAATLFYLLVGEPPGFELYLRMTGDVFSQKALMDFNRWRLEVSDWERPRPSSFRRNIPERLSDLIHRTLSPRPADRPNDVAAFRQDFDVILQCLNRARSVQKYAMPGLRKALKQTFSAAAEGVDLFMPLDNSNTFLQCLRNAIVQARFPDAFVLSDEIVRAGEFNGLLHQIADELSSCVTGIESNLRRHANNADSLKQSFDNDLLTFQKLLVRFLMLECKLGEVLGDVVQGNPIVHVK